MATQPLSLLSGVEIKSLGLVENSVDDDLYRASTYDLSIGDIIPVGPASGGAEYKLPPGGTVRVVSRELLKLPDDVTGHALLKNELCRKGVLALNIGVIDPGFQGPISSTLINFGGTDCVVRQGAAFLRISFHRCPSSPMLAAKAAKYDRAQYIARVKDEVAAYMAPTFLNVKATAEQAAEKAFGSFKNALLVWATLGAIVLGLLAIFAPLGASFVEKYVESRDQQDQELQERYDKRLKELSDQIDELKRASTDQGAHGKVSGGRP